MSPRRLLAAAVALVAVLALGAYAVLSARGRAADDPGWLDSLERVQGDWVSVTGYAHDGTTPWTAPVRLTVEGTELRIRAGCNTLVARVTVEDHRLRSRDGVVSTAMGCPPEAMARDAWLAALVDDHATVQLTGSAQGPMFALDTDAGWVGFVRTRTP